MSFQWTFIAGYLYLEIAIIVIMITPMISSLGWFRSFFRSQTFRAVCDRTAVYFYGWTGLLSLFLFDAIQQIRQHLRASTGSKGSALLSSQIKLFRAQRNFYITTFAIFLAFVIRRLARIIMVQMELEERGRTIITEAEGQMRQARITVNTANNQEEDIAIVYQETKNQLESAQKLLKEQQLHAVQLNREITMWKKKYEEVTDGIEDHGDN